MMQFESEIRVVRATILYSLVIGVLCTLSTPILAQAGSDQALVIFHRADVLKARAIRFNIEQDGVPVGQLPAGQELRLSVDPGTYMFTVRAPSWDGMDHLSLTVEAGKTYSIEGEVLWSWPVGRPKFKDVVESGVAVPQRAPAATASAAPAAATTARAPASPSNTSASTGLDSFVGEWNVQVWSLAADGRRLEGQGTASGAKFGDLAVDITINEFIASDLPDATGGGAVRITNHPERGLTLETDLPVADRKLQLTGQVSGGAYVFYLVGGGGETVTGIRRTSVRIEVRSLSADAWEAATYASVDGETVQVQGTRFTRR